MEIVISVLTIIATIGYVIKLFSNKEYIMILESNNNKTIRAGLYSFVLVVISLFIGIFIGYISSKIIILPKTLNYVLIIITCILINTLLLQKISIQSKVLSNLFSYYPAFAFYSMVVYLLFKSFDFAILVIILISFTISIINIVLIYQNHKKRKLLEKFYKKLISRKGFVFLFNLTFFISIILFSVLLANYKLFDLNNNAHVPYVGVMFGALMVVVSAYGNQIHLFYLKKNNDDKCKYYFQLSSDNINKYIIEESMGNIFIMREVISNEKKYTYKISDEILSTDKFINATDLIKYKIYKHSKEELHRFYIERINFDKRRSIHE